jgi:hypothetical protein
LARRLIAALLLALLVVAYVVWRDADRSDARFTIVSGPPDPVVPFVLPKKPMRFHLRPTSVAGKGRVLVQVGTYLQPAKDTLTFTIFGVHGKRITRCAFPPTGYRDNDQLTCPVPDIGAVRSLLVVRKGNAKIALSAHDDTAGYLAREEQSSLLGRASTVLSRIAWALPDGVGSFVTVFGLFASVALTAFALLFALRRHEEEAAASETGRGDEPVESHEP